MPDFKFPYREQTVSSKTAVSNLAVINDNVSQCSAEEQFGAAKSRPAHLDDSSNSLTVNLTNYLHCNSAASSVQPAERNSSESDRSVDENATEQVPMNSPINSQFGQSSAMFNSLHLSDFNSTTIEIDPSEQLELQKDNHLIEFNRLEDILNFCNPRNTILVQLKKGLRGLGISLCGGKQTKIDESCEHLNSSHNFALINQLIRVKKLYPAHPASECGLIDENDFILDVNGHCFVGLTYIVSMCALSFANLAHFENAILFISCF